MKIKSCNLGMNKKIKALQNISLVIISLLMFLSVGECVARLIWGNPLIMQPDEVLFWKFKKKQTGRLKHYFSVARVDENGFRYSGKNYNSNIPSIYFGGDSYTWGQGVLDTETLGGQFQKYLDSNDLNYNVLNGGVPGYGIEQIINRMEIESERHNVKYAVLFWYRDDINRLRNISPEKKRKFLRDYTIRSIFRYSAFLKLIKEMVFDTFLRKEVGLGNYTDRNIKYKEKHSFSERIEGLTPKIKENVSFLKSKNIIPVWVILNIPAKKPKDKEDLAKFKEYLYSLSKELSVKFIDPEPVYRKHFPGLENMMNRHFKPIVYKLIAYEILGEALLEDLKNMQSRN